MIASLREPILMVAAEPGSQSFMSAAPPNLFRSSPSVCLAARLSDGGGE